MGNNDISDNENFYENSLENSESYSLSDEIFRMEKVVDKMETDIENLWHDVIVPYLTNYSKLQVLDELDENSFDKFYGLMINKNSTFKRAIKYLNYLRRLESNNQN
jgi:hypothetical protein